MNPPSKPRQVGISYAWSTEKNPGPHQAAVEDFCQRLEKSGIGVIRDVDQVKWGDSLSAFMRRLGTSDFLCVFLSDAYLRSPNCMYELLVAWQRSKDNPAEFRDRVKVWVMQDGGGVRKMEGRREYRKHWDQEAKRLAELLREEDVRRLPPGEVNLVRRVEEIAHHVGDMLSHFADTLSPKSIDEFEAWVRKHFPEAKPKLEAELLDRVYPKTIAELEELVSRNPKLQQLFAGIQPQVFDRQADEWKLTQLFVQRKFAADTVFKAIKDRLRLGGLTRSDLDDLELAIGGLLVLSVNPRWVLEQRDLLSRLEIEVPALRTNLPLGASRHADLLHLVSVALADGLAHLQRVFGEPLVDARQVPDPSRVTRGITEPDIRAEIQLHFIRYVLGPAEPVNASSAAEVDVLFKRVNEVLAYALREERHPYYGTGPAFQRLTTTLRNELRMSDLLLLQPSGQGREEELLSNPVIVMKHLCAIFDWIERQRGPRSSPVAPHVSL